MAAVMGVILGGWGRGGGCRSMYTRPKFLLLICTQASVCSGGGLLQRCQCLGSTGSY